MTARKTISKPAADKLAKSEPDEVVATLATSNLAVGIAANSALTASGAPLKSTATSEWTLTVVLVL